MSNHDRPRDAEPCPPRKPRTLGYWRTPGETPISTRVSSCICANPKARAKPSAKATRAVRPTRLTGCTTAHRDATMRTRTSSRLLALACAMTGAGRSASAQQDASCGTGGVLLTDRVTGLQTGKSSHASLAGDRFEDICLSHLSSPNLATACCPNGLISCPLNMPTVSPCAIHPLLVIPSPFLTDSFPKF